ncbi:hypothetical protein Tco_0639099 [Tanacetum coccineum]
MTVSKSSDQYRDSWSKGASPTEEAKQKIPLGPLPSVWSQVSLIMRTKPGVDSLNFDDLYNNLRVFENDIKWNHDGKDAWSLLEIRMGEDLKAEKEKEDLKAKVEKWHNTSKNLGKRLNTQMSANDKFGLGHRDYRYDGITDYENETYEGILAVPPTHEGNYMPSGLEIEIDYHKFTIWSKTDPHSESEN